MPVIAHMKKNEKARPIGWNARSRPGPKAKPASVCAIPASVAARRPPEAAIASGNRSSTPIAMMMLWKTSVQIAARNPP